MQEAIPYISEQKFDNNNINVPRWDENYLDATGIVRWLRELHNINNGGIDEYPPIGSIDKKVLPNFKDILNFVKEGHIYHVECEYKKTDSQNPFVGIEEHRIIRNRMLRPELLLTAKIEYQKDKEQYIYLVPVDNGQSISVNLSKQVNDKEFYELVFSKFWPQVLEVFDNTNLSD